MRFCVRIFIHILFIRTYFRKQQEREEEMALLTKTRDDLPTTRKEKFLDKHKSVK
jgi:hypothetical protein